MYQGVCSAFLLHPPGRSCSPQVKKGYPERWVTDVRTHRNVNSGQVGTKKARITKAPLGSHEWRAQFLQIPRMQEMQEGYS